jgi:hypothetical protein
MLKKYLCIFLVMILCACVNRSLAMGEVMEVTKENQAKLGLVFTLTADRLSPKVVLVSMEIPRSGKLKEITGVNLTIGHNGSPALEAALRTRPGKDGAWAVNFQLSAALADECSIDLTVPQQSETYLIYSVALKGYVKDRK